MILLVLFPFLLQALTIFADEFFFHVKRGLPRWERIGHPLDTLSVLICFAFVLLFPCNALYLKIYIALALFSCIFVTKDEFVHKECCPASEQWLHALLFLNHPIVLTLLALLWPLYQSTDVPSFLLPFLTYRKGIILFLWGQTALVAAFGLYQAIYWNVLREKAYD